eukprot:m.142067 g.142067  ORF g.142067 m.142067 type:complete len:75 (+) comp52610_c0_seq5:130-354(+)
MRMTECMLNCLVLKKIRSLIVTIASVSIELIRDEILVDTALAWPRSLDLLRTLVVFKPPCLAASDLQQSTPIEN